MGQTDELSSRHRKLSGQSVEQKFRAAIHVGILSLALFRDEFLNVGQERRALCCRDGKCDRLCVVAVAGSPNNPKRAHFRAHHRQLLGIFLHALNVSQHFCNRDLRVGILSIDDIVFRARGGRSNLKGP
jgi:hypothetical protein